MPEPAVATPAGRDRADRRDDRLRLFVAVELSDRWRRALERLSADLRARVGDGYRWVRPELLHLTVLFLGSQPTGGLTSIHEALDRAAASRPPFRLHPGQLGSFGGRRPSVLWFAAVDRSGMLAPLRSRLDAELVARGVTFDSKPLVPHITLARARPSTGRQPAAPPALPAINVAIHEPLAVDQLALIRSDLGPSGPHYTVLERASLRGPG